MREVTMIRANPQYIQNFIMKEEYERHKNGWPEYWTEEDAREYARTAEFGPMTKMMMLAAEHPIVWTVIFSVIVPAIITLILAKE